MTLETLFPYQHDGARWLASMPHALLADEMGVGKSAQAVRACDLVQANDILIVCPGAVRINWQREFVRFSPMDRDCTLLVTSTDRPARGVNVVSYDLLAQPTADGADRTLDNMEHAVRHCSNMLANFTKPIFPTEQWQMMAKWLGREVVAELNAPNVGVAHFLLTRDFPLLLQKAKRRLEVAKTTEKERRKFVAALKDRAWDVIILDEAHFLKERTSDRTRTVYGHRGLPGLAARGKRVWRLTGTPAPNDASELYTQFISAGIIKVPYWDFVFEFCNYDSERGKITGTKNANVGRLKALLGQFMLRRKKEDVNLQLPPITFTQVTVERSEVELDPYFYENWRPLGEGITGQRLFLANLKTVDTNLKQSMDIVATGHHANFADAIKLLESYSKSTAQLRRYLGLAKVPRVADIIEEELASGAVDKIVIFAIHAQVIEGLRARFRKYGAVTLYGNTPQRKRQGNIDAFQNNPKTRVFIGQIVAAGTGITLTAAHEVAFIEADWVPANNAQAAMRCHRVGQTRSVRVRFFNCAGSVDEQVNQVLLTKTREIAKFIG